MQLVELLVVEGRKALRKTPPEGEEVQDHGRTHRAQGVPQGQSLGGGLKEH